MMFNEDILRYIANKITNGSRYYTAEISASPRSYHERFGQTIGARLVNGIIIKRLPYVHFLPSSSFIFESDIIRYVNRLARKDNEFARRLNTMELNPDDIEALVRHLTFDRIHPCLRGRKIFPA